MYTENGKLCPVNAVIVTPRNPNTIAIRNTGHIDSPLAADLFINDEGGVAEPSVECVESLTDIDGGATRTYPFDTSVDSVQVLIMTDGQPLNARIELLQESPDNKDDDDKTKMKQVYPREKYVLTSFLLLFVSSEPKVLLTPEPR